MQGFAIEWEEMGDADSGIDACLTDDGDRM